MAAMEPYIKEWYDYLKQGKMMGLKCSDCGDVEFPPFPTCNHCGSLEHEWVEIDGTGELLTFSYSPMGVYPYNFDEVITGYGRLKEGMLFCAPIEGLDGDNIEELLERLRKGPIPFTLVPTPMDENVTYPYMRLKDGE